MSKQIVLTALLSVVVLMVGCEDTAMPPGSGPPSDMGSGGDDGNGSGGDDGNGSGSLPPGTQIDIAAQDVAWGGGVFVAVGASAYWRPDNVSQSDTYWSPLSYSIDGVTWSPAESIEDEFFEYPVLSPGRLSFNRVVYGNGVFVAFGETEVPPSTRPGRRNSLGTFYYSADGKNWREVPSIPSSINSEQEWINWNAPYLVKDLAFGNGRFVAVGNRVVDVAYYDTVFKVYRTLTRPVPLFYYSTDGVNWTEASSRPEYPSDLLYLDDLYMLTEAVAFGDGRFVSTAAEGAVFDSSDGDVWRTMLQTVLDPVLGTVRTYYNHKAIAWGNDRFVAVDDRDIYYSFNGVDWERISIHRELDIFTRMRDVVWGQDGFVAVDGCGHILYSKDGDAWSIRAGPFNVAFDAIAWSEQLALFVAVSGSAIYRSPDGVTWSVSKPGARGITELPSGTACGGSAA